MKRLLLLLFCLVALSGFAVDPHFYGDVSGTTNYLSSKLLFTTNGVDTNRIFLERLTTNSGIIGLSDLSYANNVAWTWTPSRNAYLITAGGGTHNDGIFFDPNNSTAANTWIWTNSVVGTNVQDGINNAGGVMLICDSLTLDPYNVNALNPFLLGRDINLGTTGDYYFPFTVLVTNLFPTWKIANSNDWRVIYPEMSPWNAIPGGQEDCTAALQACFNQCASNNWHGNYTKVHVNGPYLCNGSIFVSGPLWLEGNILSGDGYAALALSGGLAVFFDTFEFSGTNSLIFFSRPGFTISSGVVISGCAFHGDGTVGSQAILFDNNPYGECQKVINCSFYNFDKAIINRFPDNFQLISCGFQSGSNAVIQTSTGGGVNNQSSYFQNIKCWLKGVDFKFDSSQIHITSYDSQNRASGSTSIEATNASRIILDNCNFDSVTTGFPSVVLNNSSVHVRGGRFSGTGIMVSMLNGSSAGFDEDAALVSDANGISILSDASSLFNEQIDSWYYIRVTNSTLGITNWVGRQKFFGNGNAPVAISPFPASGVNWTNFTQTSIQIYIDNSNVTGTVIKKNGTTISSGTAVPLTYSLILQQREYFSEAYTVNTPSATYSPVP